MRMAFSTVSFDIVDVPLQSHSRPPKKQEKVKKKIFLTEPTPTGKKFISGKKKFGHTCDSTLRDTGDTVKNMKPRDPGTNLE